jgi:two-component system, sensor histidine kinase and response regulator
MEQTMNLEPEDNIPTQKFPLVTILIAEDNAVNMLLAQSIIENLLPNVKIIEAENGLIAIEKFKSERPDIVFMDVRMPEKNGYEAAREIRSAEQSWGKSTPIIALTAGTAKGERERCLEAGMNDYISKPIVQDSILVALKKWLPLPFETELESVKTKNSSSHTHFDAAEIINQLGRNQSLMKKMVSSALSNIETCLVSLHKNKGNLTAGDFPEQVHKLKGIALTAWFGELAKMAGQLEEMTDAEAQPVDELLRSLENEVQLVKQIVSERLTD